MVLTGDSLLRGQVGRLREFDLLRAVAIIFILISHGIGTPFPAAANIIGNVGNSLFFFMSGILLRPTSDLKGFYLHRLRKIYPWYLVALLLYVLEGSLRGYTTIVYLFGLQEILNVKAVGDLWFVGSILVFYLFYPFISKSPYRALFAFIALLALHFGAGFVLIETVSFFPVFGAGVLIAPRLGAAYSLTRRDLSHLLLFALLSVGALFISRFEGVGFETAGPILPVVAVPGCLVALYLARGIRIESRVVQVIATYSYQIYLFHPFVYALLGI
jgi:peptidoglycan/LPS O-acetylase OafA/YrhL